MPAYPLTLYYDATCPLCMAEMRNLMLRNTGGQLAFVDASAPDFASPVPHADQSALMRALHGVWADGHTVVGVDAIHEAYRAVGLGWVTAFTQWPVLDRMSARLYRWIALHRHSLPRRLVLMVFEGASRRAAQRAHARMNCHANGHAQGCGWQANTNSPQTHQEGASS